MGGVLLIRVCSIVVYGRCFIDLVIRVCSIVVYGRCFIDQGVFYCSIWEVFY